VNVDPEMSSRVALPVRVRVGEAIDFLGQSDERPASGVADDRHDQAAVGGRRQPKWWARRCTISPAASSSVAFSCGNFVKRPTVAFMMNGRYDQLHARSARRAFALARTATRSCNRFPRRR